MLAAALRSQNLLGSVTIVSQLLFSFLQAASAGEVRYTRTGSTHIRRLRILLSSSVAF